MIIYLESHTIRPRGTCCKFGNKLASKQRSARSSCKLRISKVRKQLHPQSHPATYRFQTHETQLKKLHMSTCPLLDSLPPELRLQIYTHLFSTPTHTSLLLRSPTKIELISFARNAHAGILKTCRTLYREAAPILYDTVTFRFQIYPEDGFPATGRGRSGGLMESALFLRWVRRMEIKACVIRGGQTAGAVALIEGLTGALGEVGAELVAVRMVSNFRLGPREGEIYRRREAEGGEEGRGRELFRKVLDVIQESTDGSMVWSSGWVRSDGG